MQSIFHSRVLPGLVGGMESATPGDGTASTSEAVPHYVDCMGQIEDVVNSQRSLAGDESAAHDGLDGQGSQVTSQTNVVYRGAEPQSPTIGSIHYPRSGFVNPKK